MKKVIFLTIKPLAFVLTTLMIAFLVYALQTKPTVHQAPVAGDVDFILKGLFFFRPVTSIKIWSHTKDIHLWWLDEENWSEKQLKQSKLKYGIIPARMEQVFPKHNVRPSKINENEIIITSRSIVDYSPVFSELLCDCSRSRG